jgi:LL-diaminopimelate aminotransferase
VGCLSRCNWQLYLQRKNIAIDIMISLGCAPLKSGAGMFVWARIPDDAISAEAMADEILYEGKVFVTPGHIFGSNGERYLRISLCSDESQLKQALERVRALNLANA